MRANGSGSAPRLPGSFEASLWGLRARCRQSTCRQAPSLAAGRHRRGRGRPRRGDRGTIRQFGGYRAVSLFLVTGGREARSGDREKDERWLYQARMAVVTESSGGSFVAREAATVGAAKDDGEVAILELIYRDAPTLAIGHGVAASWSSASGYPARCERIWTEHIPDFEVPNMVPNESEGAAAQLDMYELSQLASAAAVIDALAPLIEDYERWIEETSARVAEPPIADVLSFRDAAEVNLRSCREAATRMQVGLELLSSDPDALEAFKFANKAMWDQRIHSSWAEHNRRHGSVAGTPADYDAPENRRWRPFQLAFVLMTLAGIVDEKSAERELVDLLWFPTGGGKTEAYLGLAAFTLAMRRLRGERHGRTGEAGTAIIMRYTLRLLTVQQFQRAAALIAACETIRVEDEPTWGSEPFSIGLWVGQSTTPNSYSDSVKALSDINELRRPRTGSPVQLLHCPRCGAELATSEGRPHSQTYIPDDARKRTVIACRNPECEFCARRSDNRGLPVVVVDEESLSSAPITPHRHSGQVRPDAFQGGHSVAVRAP